MGPWGPLREEGPRPPPLGLAPRVGPIPPLAGAPPPLGSLVPHGGGEDDGTPPPWPIYGGVHPPFSKPTQSLSLLLLPREDSPCLESAPGLEFSTIAGRRSDGVGIRIR